MRYHVDLTTPEAVARQLNTVNPDGELPAILSNTASGQYANFWSYVTDACKSASEFITEQTTRSFVPFKADLTLYWDDIKTTLRNGRLVLGDDLLTLSDVTFNDTSLDPTLYRTFPPSSLPTTALVLAKTSLSGQTFDFTSAFVISGIWGTLTHLASAWSVIQSSITIGADASTITVSANTANRYETLMYLRCETEYLQITAIDLTTDVLTVTRGVNGTASAAHDSATLDKFNVKEDVRKGATDLAVYYYQKRTPVGSLQLPNGAMVLDVAFPSDVKALIKNYQPLVMDSP